MYIMVWEKVVYEHQYRYFGGFEYRDCFALPMQKSYSSLQQAEIEL